MTKDYQENFFLIMLKYFLGVNSIILSFFFYFATSHSFASYALIDLRNEKNGWGLVIVVGVPHAPEQRCRRLEEEAKPKIATIF
jgi:hypothetical protein